jgi:hypothetical protein
VIGDRCYPLPPTTYHLPPTTYHLPPTTYHLPPTTYHLPPIIPAMSFHRRESPAQTAAEAAKQERSQEISGASVAGSSSARVRAYIGPLPKGARGVEFDTDVLPDDGSPPGEARWTGPRLGIVVEDGVAKLSAQRVENRQK